MRTRTVLVAAVVAVSVLTAVPSFATLEQRRDGNDAGGRLDLRSGGIGHNRRTVFGEAAILGGLDEEALRRGNFIAFHYDVDLDGQEDYQVLVHTDQDGMSSYLYRWRRGDRARRLREVPLATDGNGVRVTVRKRWMDFRGRRTIKWIVSSRYEDDRGCEQACRDWVPNLRDNAEPRWARHRV